MATYLIGNVKGPKGDDGVSPSARVEQTSNGAVITITDASGTSSAFVRNGYDADGDPIDFTIYATKLEVEGQIEDLADIYATKEEVEDIEIPVSSVNGMTGDVVITPPDLSGYATQSWIQAQGYMTEAPVDSVNGKTGTVVLAASDVGALPANTVIPSKTSDLSNDSNYVNMSTMNSFLSGKQDRLTAGANITISGNVISAAGGGITTELDPVFSASPAANITSNDISRWDNKSNFSGNYNDLTNKPTFSLVATTGNYNDLTNKPNLSDFATTTALTAGLATKQDTLTAGDNITISNNVISATGGSNYGDEDVAEYIEDTFGMGFSDETRSNTIMSESVDSNTKTVPQSLNLPVLNLEILMEDVQAEPICQYVGGLNTDFENNVATLVIDDVFELSVPIDSSGNQSGNGTITFNSSYVGVGASFTINSLINVTVATPLQTQFIPIDNNTIRVNSNGKLEAQSSGGSTYTAGTGIDITNDEISIDNTVVALKSDIPAAELPVAPAADGIYFLSTTVSSGTATHSWVSIPAAAGNNF